MKDFEQKLNDLEFFYNKYNAPFRIIDLYRKTGKISRELGFEISKTYSKNPPIYDENNKDKKELITYLTKYLKWLYHDITHKTSEIENTINEFKNLTDYTNPLKEQDEIIEIFPFPESNISTQLGSFISDILKNITYTEDSIREQINYFTVINEFWKRDLYYIREEILAKKTIDLEKYNLTEDNLKLINKIILDETNDLKYEPSFNTPSYEENENDDLMDGYDYDRDPDQQNPDFW